MSGKARILFDARWVDDHGIGRVALEYRNRLQGDYEVLEIDGGPKPSSPLDPLRVAHAFSRSRADLFFSPGYNGSPLIGSRLVFMVHDFIHMSPLQPGGFQRRAYYDLITRRAASLGRMITVSKASALAIEQRWPELRGRIAVAPNGLSAEFRYSPGDRRQGVALFGNARWHKNLPRMLAAIARLQQSSPAFAEEPVVIVGEGGPAADLAASLGVVSVSITGRLADRELAHRLNTVRALMVCSLAEGFGLPVIEALACGCAVVASDLPVFRELAGDACIFVDPLSVSSIANGLQRALHSKPDLDTARTLPGRFDWDKGYSVVRATIEQALAATRAQGNV